MALAGNSDPAAQGRTAVVGHHVADGGGDVHASPGLPAPELVLRSVEIADQTLAVGQGRELTQRRVACRLQRADPRSFGLRRHRWPPECQTPTP